MLANAGFKLGDTPSTISEIKQFLLNIPLNTDVIFFDLKGLQRDEPIYGSGIPPFLRIRKELNNALGAITYREADNRNPEGDVTFTEDNIDKMCQALERQAKLLQKYAIKTQQVPFPNLPVPIGPKRGTVIHTLDKKKRPQM